MTKTIYKMIHICCVNPWAAILLFAACVDSLLAGYIAEHFFDVLPCDLCIKQRIPFALVLAIMLPALSMKLSGDTVRKLLGLSALVLIANAGIAGFHSGVELQWWGGLDGCGVNPLVFADDPVAMREMLLNAPVVRCDEVNFTFLGLTIANWNIFWSLGLAGFAAMAAFYPVWRYKWFRL